jgi:hypothetical protein
MFEYPEAFEKSKHLAAPEHLASRVGDASGL